MRLEGFLYRYTNVRGAMAPSRPLPPPLFRPLPPCSLGQRPLPCREVEEEQGRGERFRDTATKNRARDE